MVGLAAFFGLAACIGPPMHDSSPVVSSNGRTPASGTSAPAITSHVYDEIFTFGSEMQGYGLYTYVLFPKKVTVGSDVASRYIEILKEIKKSTDTAEVGLAAGLRIEESNIFYLPAGDEDNRRIISLKLFNHLRSSSGTKSDDLFPTNRPGPFLVSVAKPITQLSGDSPMLIADLSTTHPDAFAEVIAAYKNQLQVDGVDEKERFTSLRLSLLSWIVTANENLSLVKVALARWK